MLRLEDLRVPILSPATAGRDRLTQSRADQPTSRWRTAMMRFVCLAFLMSILARGSSAIAAEEAAPAAAATPADIELWVRNLDSDVYAERQTAMKNLRRSGVAGITALTKAARGSNLEATARAIELLTQLYESPDANVAIAADEVFVKKFAKTLKVPYHTICFDTNAFAEKEKLSTQVDIGLDV